MIEIASPLLCRGSSGARRELVVLQDGNTHHTHAAAAPAAQHNLQAQLSLSTLSTLCFLPALVPFLYQQSTYTYSR